MLARLNSVYEGFKNLCKSLSSPKPISEGNMLPSSLTLDMDKLSQGVLKAIVGKGITVFIFSVYSC